MNVQHFQRHRCAAPFRCTDRTKTWHTHTHTVAHSRTMVQLLRHDRCLIRNINKLNQMKGTEEKKDIMNKWIKIFGSSILLQVYLLLVSSFLEAPTNKNKTGKIPKRKINESAKTEFRRNNLLNCVCSKQAWTFIFFRVQNDSMVTRIVYIIIHCVFIGNSFQNLTSRCLCAVALCLFSGHNGGIFSSVE